MHDIIIDMNSNLDLSTVEHIIKEYVEEKTGKVVAKIEPKIVDSKFNGFTIHYNSEIPEVTVINNLEKPKKPIKIDTTFRPWVIE